MVNRLIRRHGFDLRLETELREIVDDGHGRVGAAVTSGGERLDGQLVGLTAGVSPNIDLVRGVVLKVGVTNLVTSDRFEVRLNGQSLSGEACKRTGIHSIDPYAGLASALPTIGVNCRHACRCSCCRGQFSASVGLNG